MQNRRRRAAVAIVTAFAVAAGLGAFVWWPRPMRYEDPPPEQTAALDAQARSVLAGWDREHPGQPVRSYVPVWPDLPSERLGWTFLIPPNAGIERGGGQRLATTAPLPDTPPSPSTVVWQDGVAEKTPLVSAAEAFAAVQAEPCRYEPCDGPPVRVTGAKLGTVPARTAHGWASVPAWLFTIDDGDSRIARIAVDLEASRYADSFTGPQYARVARGILPAARSVPPATPGPYDTALIVDYVGAPGGTGPCTSEYATHVVEAATAVVVVVQPMVRPQRVRDDERGIICDPPLGPWGPYRQTTVYLSRPLGERVLLGLDGEPLMVTRQR